MKRIPGLILSAFFLALILILPFHTSHKLQDETLRGLAVEVVKAIPQDVHMRLMAVTDIKGDDGSLQRAIEGGLKANPHFIIVERKNLNKILDEVGLQVSDLVDRKTRIEPGKLQGVEGILFGEILDERKSPLKASLRAYLKLDNVETGAIVLSKEFSVTAVSPARNIILWTLCGILGLIFLIVALRKHEVTVIKKKEERDEEARGRIRTELDKASRSLTEARDSLMGKGEKVMAQAVRDVESDLRLLRERMEILARIDSGGIKKEAKMLLRFDEHLLGYFRNIAYYSEKLYKDVMNDDFKHLKAKSGELKKEIKDTLNRLEDRNTK